MSQNRISMYKKIWILKKITIALFLKEVNDSFFEWLARVIKITPNFDYLPAHLCPREAVLYAAGTNDSKLRNCITGIFFKFFFKPI